MILVSVIPATSRMVRTRRACPARSPLSSRTPFNDGPILVASLAASTGSKVSSNSVVLSGKTRCKAWKASNSLSKVMIQEWAAVP